MGSDGSGAARRTDPRFSPLFQRGAPGSADAALRSDVANSAVPSAARSVSVPSGEPWGTDTDALEAAFAELSPLDEEKTDTEPGFDVPSAPAVDETRALGFVRACAIGALTLVALLLAGSVIAQNMVRTSPTGGEWVYFVSQFVFIAAPGLFVLGIAALVFVGYRRRLAPPHPEERTTR